MKKTLCNTTLRTLVTIGMITASHAGLAASDADTATGNIQEDYLLRGQEIARSAQSALGSQLMQAISAGGPVGAIDFCKDNAGPIAQRVSRENNAGIRRATDRPRNPRNAANADELAYIEQATAALARGDAPKPALGEHEGRMRAYYPIVTNAMCLQCHGDRDMDIAADTRQALQLRYPDDQAWGYGVNDLRGIFVITMEDLTPLGDI